MAWEQQVGQLYEWADLEHQLAHIGLRLGKLTQAFDLPSEDIRISNAHASDDQIPVVEVEVSADVDNAPFFGNFKGRILHVTGVLGPYLADYAKRSPFILRFNLSDVGGACALSFDRPADADWALFPDLYLLEARRSFERGDYGAAETDGDFETTFSNRQPLLFWRGSTTSGGWIRSLDELRTNYRVDACLRVAAAVGAKADCRISKLVQWVGAGEDEAVTLLHDLDVYADFVPESRFADFQMYLDLPGNAGSWGTCHKHLAGILVLKVPSGRELAYTHLLRPWKHYVPIARDMSDVAERVSWVLDHPAEATAIARRGKERLWGFLKGLPVYMLRTLEMHNISPEKKLIRVR
ncbi:MAG TPA: glycosyl transferase family 90 [Beijerinckiaceae bacterium]|nr:glycosyl transferase family 90 [Beijerinckiaceae bacterium]